MLMRSIRSFSWLAILPLAAVLALGCGGDGDGGDWDFCETNCPAVVAAGCSNGPADQTECLEGCQAAETACPQAFDDMKQCAGKDASYTCGDYNFPEAAGCRDESYALQACMEDGEAYCYLACPAVVAAGCSNGPADPGECLEGCNQAAESCPTEFDAMTQCAGTDASYTCGEYDSPLAEGCQEESYALQACMEDGDAYCYAVCPAVVAPGCSNGPGDLGECLDGCNDAASGCPDEFADLKQCAGTDASFSCDASDSPAPDGCTAENDALNACMSEL